MFFLIVVLPLVILFQIQTIVAYKTSQASIMVLKNKNATDYAVTEALNKLCFGINAFWIGFLVFLAGSILLRNIAYINAIFVFLTIIFFGDLIITSCIYLPVLKKYDKEYYKKVTLGGYVIILIMILVALIIVEPYIPDISIVRYHEYIDSESDNDANIKLIVGPEIRMIYNITADDLIDYENGDLLLIVHSPWTPHVNFYAGGLPKGETYREYIGRYLTNTNVPVNDRYIGYTTDVSFIIKLADGTEDDIIFVERESEGSKGTDVY